jgi:hypothetical protein
MLCRTGRRRYFRRHLFDLPGMFLVIVCCLGLVSGPLPPSACAQEREPAAPASGSEPSAGEAELVARYRDLGRRALRIGIELERFSLNYRLNGTRRSKLMALQFAGTQEAGAAGALAVNILGMREFGAVHSDPEKFNGDNLRKGARAAMITSIIAAAGSTASLSYNTFMAVSNGRKGYSSKHARQFVRERLAELDRLLAEREAIVAAHPEHRYYELAKSEGKILRLMRAAFVLEFSTFLHDVHRLRVDENLFYVLNSAANAMSAVSAFCLDRAVSDRRYFAHAGITGAVCGLISTFSPLTSTFCGIAAGRLAQHRFAREAGGVSASSVAELSQEVKHLEEMLAKSAAAGEPRPRGIARAALYSQSSQNFSEELRREMRIMKYLNEVAAQSDIVGPAVGGTILSQGILTTCAHYLFGGKDERKKALLDYRGSVIGAAGSGVAVAVTAGAMIFDIYYMHRLEKKQKLPEQLIEQRLKYIEETESIIDAL